MNEIKHIAYEKYKLDWIMNHGYTIQDILRLSGEYFLKANADYFFVEKCEEYIEKVGFDGMIWTCFNEFLDSEYQDTEYMGRLLNSYEFYEYKKDIGKEN